MMVKIENRYRGQRCFILGNGPSLNYVDLTKLKDEITFGCNRIYIKNLGFPLTCYFAIDRKFNEYARGEIQAYLRSDADSPRTFFVKGQYEGRYEHPEKVTVSLNYVSVGEAMLDTAIDMGCRPIYLIGIDMDYSGLNENIDIYGEEATLKVPDRWHFDSRYWTGKFYYRDTQVGVAYDRFKDKVEQMRNKKEILVFNASGNGLLDYIPTVNYEDLFI